MKCPFETDSLNA